MTLGRTQGREIFVPTDSFTAKVDGVDVLFRKGETRVREGHQILDDYPDLFEPIRAHYDVEAATAAPGERRR